MELGLFCKQKLKEAFILLTATGRLKSPLVNGGIHNVLLLPADDFIGHTDLLNDIVLLGQHIGSRHPSLVANGFFGISLAPLFFGKSVVKGLTSLKSGAPLLGLPLLLAALCTMKIPRTLIRGMGRQMVVDIR